MDVRSCCLVQEHKTIGVWSVDLESEKRERVVPSQSEPSVSEAVWRNNPSIVGRRREYYYPRRKNCPGESDVRNSERIFEKKRAFRVHYGGQEHEIAGNASPPREEVEIHVIDTNTQNVYIRPFALFTPLQPRANAAS
jgi:hypothetical protein